MLDGFSVSLSDGCCVGFTLVLPLPEVGGISFKTAGVGLDAGCTEAGSGVGVEAVGGVWVAGDTDNSWIGVEAEVVDGVEVTWRGEGSAGVGIMSKSVKVAFRLLGFNGGFDP